MTKSSGPTVYLALFCYEEAMGLRRHGPSDLDAAGLGFLICLVPSRLWHVWPALGQFAKDHELVMYDPQQQHVFLPPRLSGSGPGRTDRHLGDRAHGLPLGLAVGQLAQPPRDVR